MPTYFASRVNFTIAGAPSESFFIDDIKSVFCIEDQQNVPFNMMHYQPISSSFIDTFKHVEMEIKYYTSPRKKTFDFSLLPYGIASPLQITVYKKEDILCTLTNVFYNGSSVEASRPSFPLVLSVKFLGTAIIYNTYL